MEIIKTICPQCLKIFDAEEKFDEVECHFCGSMYTLPKLVPRIKDVDLISMSWKK